MPTVRTILAALKAKGDPRRIQAFAPHGAPADLFGVSVADMKAIAKTIKGEQELACQLYDTGNGDAMYLAGLVADGSRMTKRQLDSWARQSSWSMISEYTIPGVATESRFAHDLATKWIASKKESIASSGWNTFAGIVTVTPDQDLDLTELRALLKRVEAELPTGPNRVRYTMNGFVIAVGAYVYPLLAHAKASAKKLGKVAVDMHGTACKVPLATAYIEKIEKAGRVGRKRKTIKC